MEFLAKHFGRLMLLFFGGTLAAISIYNGIPAENTLKEVTGTLTSVDSYNGSNSTRYTEVKLDSSDLTFYYGTDSKACGNIHDKLTNLKRSPLTIKYASQAGSSASKVHVVYDTRSGASAVCSYAEISASKKLQGTWGFYFGLGAVAFSLFFIFRATARSHRASETR